MTDADKKATIYWPLTMHQTLPSTQRMIILINPHNTATTGAQKGHTLSENGRI